MQWKVPRQLSYNERFPKEKPWHWWFAWYPVETDGVRIWLEWIPRRFVRGPFRSMWDLNNYKAEYCRPEHSIAGNVLGHKEGRRHGPHKGKLDAVGSPKTDPTR